MFCPQCDAEYLDGVVTCADCEVPLVAEDPRAVAEEATSQPRGDWRFEPVYRTTNPAEIAAITSAFDARQIVYHVYDQHASLGMGSVVVAARIVARSDQVELASALLEELGLSHTVDAGDDRTVERGGIFDSGFATEADADHASRDAPDAAHTPHTSAAADAPLVCPDCRLPLEADATDGIVKHVCANCNGIWFAAADFVRYAEFLARQLLGARIPDLVYAQPEEVAPCPACLRSTLRWGRLGDITAARCNDCDGVFLASDSA